MFYQEDNSNNVEMPRIEMGKDFSFGAHFHNSFEFIAVTEGEMLVTVDKKQYAVTPGSAILVFPNQPHSLHTEMHSKHILCIFSKKMVNTFSIATDNKIPTSAAFDIDNFYVKKLFELADDRSLIKSKGLLYSICAEFNKNASYIKQISKSETLLRDIFDFAEKNYKTDCTLDTLSRYTTYNSVYLSKYFKQRTGINYTDYINKLRINEAIYLISTTDDKMVNISLRCGFNTIRNFNRKFKEVTGQTPKEYRSELQHSL